MKHTVKRRFIGLYLLLGFLCGMGFAEAQPDPTCPAADLVRAKGSFAEAYVALQSHEDEDDTVWTGAFEDAQLSWVIGVSGLEVTSPDLLNYARAAAKYLMSADLLPPWGGYAARDKRWFVCNYSKGGIKVVAQTQVDEA